MENFLIFIKHHLGFLWEIIEWGNGLMFSFIYQSKLERILPDVFRESEEPPFSYRRLNLSDAEALHNLIHSQKESDLEYFSPHGFEIKTIKKQFNNRSFLMMGVFDRQKIAGYFFLRFFANKKCFVGRLIDKEYRGKGAGLVMNKIMYETSWRMDFRCLSTISKNNIAVMRAHSKNPGMIILKELANEYLMVEFVRNPREY
jgi:RimJ/RimL family protein N-acetyltransferase